MDVNQQLLAAFGVESLDARLQEKNETLLFRLNPNKYIKKTGTVVVPDDKHCIKLDIYSGQRLAKSFCVYESPTSEIYLQAQDLFAKVATSHLTETIPATVNQYKR